MRFGIIAEGREDQEIITNILRAFGIDGSDVVRIRPSLQRDATDANNQTIGTFQGVKNACLGNNGKRPDFEKAFLFSDIKLIIIHLDTAEIDNQNFDFQRPTKNNNPNYCTELRNQVIDLINGWLNHSYQNQLLYAIAIEEIEAWLLTIYEKQDTSLSANPKKKLFIHLNKEKNLGLVKLSEKFKKRKELKSFLAYNQSLKDFVLSIQQSIQSYNNELP